jgi:ubiquinone/menaquinone biosynthesis C-methylase UbiE
MAVADIGAGTGTFTRLLSDEVGPEGKVYAVEISREFLRYITSRAIASRRIQVVPVLATQDSTNLAPGSIDMAFVCETYHHIEDPEKTLASIHRALKPGGSLVVIDLDRVEGRSSAFILKHVRAGQAEVRREIKAAGFEPVPTRGPRLKESFFARFRKRGGAGAESVKMSDR